MSSTLQERLGPTLRLPALDGLRGIAVLMVLFDYAGFGAGEQDARSRDLDPGQRIVVIRTIRFCAALAGSRTPSIRSAGCAM